MEINIQSLHFDADKKLINFIEDKVGKLELFYDKILGSNITLKVDSQGKDNKVAEIKIKLPGKELFAKKQCKSFEEATDEAVEAIRKQIKKHKGKF